MSILTHLACLLVGFFGAMSVLRVIYEGREMYLQFAQGMESDHG